MNLELSGALPELSRVIAAQIECTGKLLDTLDDERLALVKQDLDRLHDSCARKLELSRQLQRLDEQLQQLRSVPRRAPAPGSASADASNPEWLGEDWQRLRQLAERCDRANRLNGALVDAREAHLRAALAALQPQPQTVYGRFGAAPLQLSGRLHDRA